MDPFSGSRKRGVEFKGSSRHDWNRHDLQNRHFFLIVLYFVGQAKGEQHALQNRQNRQDLQNRHEGYPPY